MDQCEAPAWFGLRRIEQVAEAAWEGGEGRTALLATAAQLDHPHDLQLLLLVLLRQGLEYGFHPFGGEDVFVRGAVDADQVHGVRGDPVGAWR